MTYCIVLSLSCCITDSLYSLYLHAYPFIYCTVLYCTVLYCMYCMYCTVQCHVLRCMLAGVSDTINKSNINILLGLVDGMGSEPSGGTFVQLTART